MKKTLIFFAFGLAGLAACTRTEYRDVEREVRVRDTVYIDRIVVQRDTIRLHLPASKYYGLDSLRQAFAPSAAQYPTAYAQAAPLLKSLVSAAPAGCVGLLVYWGKFNYEVGYRENSDRPTFEVLSVHKISDGVYRAVQAKHYSYSPTFSYDLVREISNASGLPAPQADFALNKLVGFVPRADVLSL